MTALARLQVDAIEVTPRGFFVVIAGHRWRMKHSPDSVRLICQRSVVDLLSNGSIRYAGADLRAGEPLRALMKRIEGET